MHVPSRSAVRRHVLSALFAGFAIAVVACAGSDGSENTTQGDQEALAISSDAGTGNDGGIACTGNTASVPECCHDGHWNSDIDLRQAVKCQSDLAKQNDAAIKACQKNAKSLSACLACGSMCNVVNPPPSCEVAGAGLACLDAACASINEQTCKKKFPKEEAGVAEAATVM